MPETQAYRVLFNETDFVTVTFDPPAISAFDADGESTCGGVWSRDLGLVSPDPDMSFVERDAVHAANRAKIAENASVPDPHAMHRAILSHAVKVATPENILDFCHVIGPKANMPDAQTTPAGVMEIEQEVSEEIDGEMVKSMRKFMVPIVSGFAIVGDDAPDHVQVSRLPSTWKIEPV